MTHNDIFMIVQPDVVQQVHAYLDDFLRIPEAGDDRLDQDMFIASRILQRREFSTETINRLESICARLEKYEQTSEQFIPQYGEELLDIYRDAGRSFDAYTGIPNMTFARERALCNQRHMATEQTRIIFPKHIRGAYHTATFLLSLQLAQKELPLRAEVLEKVYFEIFREITLGHLRKNSADILERTFRQTRRGEL